mgnify:CR=1 FL=1
MKKVLVFPCGTEIGLEINRALKYNKDYEIIGASSMDDHGKYVYEKYYGNLPMIDEENIIEEINKIIVKEKIDFIYPAHDSVVLKFSKKKEELKAKVITSEYFTCDICRSKKRTYEYFSNIILVPKMYNKKDIKEIDFPLFLKPEIGQGSKGTKKLDNIEDLNYFYKDSSQLLLEYLPYEEYTVDCFTDFNGKLIYISSRERLRISNGISVGAKEVEDKKINEIAKKINCDGVHIGQEDLNIKKAREKGEAFKILSQNEVKFLKSIASKRYSKELSDPQIEWFKDILIRLVDKGAIKRDSIDGDVDFCNKVLDALGK